MYKVEVWFIESILGLSLSTLFCWSIWLTFLFDNILKKLFPIEISSIYISFYSTNKLSLFTLMFLFLCLLYTSIKLDLGRFFYSFELNKIIVLISIIKGS